MPGVRGDQLRSRLTGRLRPQLATAVARSNRSVADVAAEYGVAWWTVHRALVAAAAVLLPASTDTADRGGRDPGPQRALAAGRCRLAPVRSLDEPRPTNDKGY